LAQDIAAADLLVYQQRLFFLFRCLGGGTGKVYLVSTPVSFNFTSTPVSLSTSLQHPSLFRLHSNTRLSFDFTPTPVSRSTSLQIGETKQTARKAHGSRHWEAAL
jgi:hypothetical protein